MTVLGLTAYNIFNPDLANDVIVGYSCGDGASVVSLIEFFDNKIKSIIRRNGNAFFEMIKTKVCMNYVIHLELTIVLNFIVS